MKTVLKTPLALIRELLEALEKRAAAGERAEREAYLAEATSIYDLEERMRKLDRMPAH